ncbi:MAG: acetate kinase, partial [Bacteroidetes bacterium]|nr:acetate kinase [Bacteroidota bacterium]
IVFTAGIGERSALVRAQICERLAWLGVDIDPEANAENAPRISTDTSAIEVLVIATDEEIVIAEATRRWA